MINKDDRIIIDNDKSFCIISNIYATEFDLIYARQSREKKDSLSIEFQIERAIDNCKYRGTDYIIYFDKGFSAGTTNRPDFQNMMNDIQFNAGIKLPKKAKAKNIVIYRYDRICRSMKDFCDLIEDLKKYKVNIISISQQIDTSTASGRAMVMQLMVFAQLEREQDSERITDNIYNRACLGYWTGGPAPFGFLVQRVKNNELDRSYPILVPDTRNNKTSNDLTVTNAEVLNEVFATIDKENSTESTAIRLNTRGFRGLQGGLWCSSRVSSIARCFSYATNTISVYNYVKENTNIQIYNSPEEFDGKKSVFVLRQTDSYKNKRPEEEQILFIGKWKGIIDGDYWVMINKKLDNNKVFPPNYGKSKKSLFSGLLICGSCLEKHNERHYYRIKNQKNHDRTETLYSYYLCSSKNKLGKDYCDNNNIEESFLVSMIKQAILEYMNNEQLIQEIYESQKESDNKGTELVDKIKDLKNKIEIIDTKIFNILDSFTDSSFKSIIEEQIKKLDSQKKSLQEDLRILEYELEYVNETKYSLDFIKKTIKNFEDIYDEATFEEKKILIRGLIKDIIIYKDHIDINFYDHLVSLKILENSGKEEALSSFPLSQSAPTYI